MYDFNDTNKYKKYFKNIYAKAKHEVNPQPYTQVKLFNFRLQRFFLCVCICVSMHLMFWIATNITVLP